MTVHCFFLPTASDFIFKSDYRYTTIQTMVFVLLSKGNDADVIMT